MWAAENITGIIHYVTKDGDKLVLACNASKCDPDRLKRVKSPKFCDKICRPCLDVVRPRGKNLARARGVLGPRKSKHSTIPRKNHRLLAGQRSLFDDFVYDGEEWREDGQEETPAADS